MTDPPIQQHDDAVTIRGEALALCYRACLALAMREHRDGVASPPLLHTLRTALYRAVMSAPGHEIASTAPTKPCCESQDGAKLIGVSEAASILFLSSRQTRRLAARNSVLGGHRIGPAWALDLGAVQALAREREASR